MFFENGARIARARRGERGLCCGGSAAWRACKLAARFVNLYLLRNVAGRGWRAGRCCSAETAGYFVFLRRAANASADTPSSAA